jgi:hypothetical protein
MGKLFGLGVREQSLLMIPFEIAEGVKEFAKFLGTGDPMALASSVQHGLAAALYAKAAGTAGGGGGNAGGGGGGGGGAAAKTQAPVVQPERTGTIIIEGIRPNEQITLTGDQLYALVDSLNQKWKEGSIVLDFAKT